jgi:hypothetical protein
MVNLKQRLNSTPDPFSPQAGFSTWQEKGSAIYPKFIDRISTADDLAKISADFQK